MSIFVKEVTGLLTFSSIRLVICLAISPKSTVYRFPDAVTTSSFLPSWATKLSRSSSACALTLEMSMKLRKSIQNPAQNSLEIELAEDGNPYVVWSVWCRV
jgi:hypothetical protein